MTVSEGATTGRVSLYILFSSYYIGAMSLALQIVLMVKILQITRKNITVLHGVILPPYGNKRQKPLPLPKPSEKAQYNIKRSVLTGLMVFSFVFALMLLSGQYIFTNLQSIGETVLQLNGRFDYLLTILRPLIEFPSQYASNTDISDMNPESVAGNLFYLWAPSLVLSVGFLNILNAAYNLVLDGILYITFKHLVA